MTLVSAPDAPVCEKHGVRMLAMFTNGRRTGWICPEPHLPYGKRSDAG